MAPTAKPSKETTRPKSSRQADAKAKADKAATEASKVKDKVAKKAASSKKAEKADKADKTDKADKVESKTRATRASKETKADKKSDKDKPAKATKEKATRSNTDKAESSKAKVKSKEKDAAAPKEKRTKAIRPPTAKAAGEDFIVSAQAIQIVVADLKFSAEPKVFNTRSHGWSASKHGKINGKDVMITVNITVKGSKKAAEAEIADEANVGDDAEDNLNGAAADEYAADDESDRNEPGNDVKEAEDDDLDEHDSMESGEPEMDGDALRIRATPSDSEADNKETSDEAEEEYEEDNRTPRCAPTQHFRSVSSNESNAPPSSASRAPTPVLIEAKTRTVKRSASAISKSSKKGATRKPSSRAAKKRRSASPE
ncbi:hypothetical protein CC85DRAFT_283548 [Cutaneotrichosporon oleaginosum]|uniref:Uncharacterized protein n=1 Tax=Cutaneotrichosporon oleaginosum TaxID=879819 RepID=A0A0J1B9S9_9TREE|nr:uncharacterized protein CC85DRAFT_283548 [Cutaneotrichosporon oleaginosum]KLT44614.1 hypothetical protein CC85DRAFT_283548 [Cutaneotrichosporon oleaginosum]TXT13871.1 hypothetical protein COLE_00064 [Cutaneotrichosporon oleaginosum]